MGRSTLPARLSRSIRTSLAAARATASRLIRTPTPETLAEIRGMAQSVCGYLATSVARAASPFFGPRQRALNVEAGGGLLPTLLHILDAIFQVPQRLLLERWPTPVPLHDLRVFTCHAVAMGMAMDKVAVELGLPVFDGGPFAGRLLAGGAR